MLTLRRGGRVLRRVRRCTLCAAFAEERGKEHRRFERPKRAQPCAARRSFSAILNAFFSSGVTYPRFIAA